MNWDAVSSQALLVSGLLFFGLVIYLWSGPRQPERDE